MNGEVYLWPSAAEKKLRTAYQTELPAYLYGVTGVGKTSLIEHFLDKKPYQYFSALNTTPQDLDTGKISAPTVVLDDLYTERQDSVSNLADFVQESFSGIRVIKAFVCKHAGRGLLPDQRTAG